MPSGNRVRCLLLMWVLVPMVAAAAPPPVTVVPTAKDIIAQSNEQGLTSIRVEGLEILYVNPQARLDGYSKVMLKPIVVRPWAEWRNRYFVAGSTRTLNLVPMIEHATAHAHRAVERELASAGYTVVDTAAADVVEVSASILDVFLIAVKAKGRTDSAESYSLGTATLIAEIRDSMSGDLILSAYDVDRGPRPKLTMHHAAEEAEAWLESTIDAWAEFLRKGLDLSNRNRDPESGSGGEPVAEPRATKASDSNG